MRRSSSFIAGLAAVSLVFAPSLALAKAGGGSSMGSRGSRTYSAPPSTNTAPSTAAPMERSMATRAPAGPAGAPVGAPARSGGFMSGLAGGLLGVGLGSMLFGGGMFGGGGGFGIMSLLSLLVQGALLFFIGRWIYRRFIGGQPAMAGGPAMQMPQPQQQAAMAMQGAAVGGTLTLNKGDYTAFEELLQGVQAAWSSADTNALRRVTTPEMAGYFAERLADQASKGVVNSVSHVKMEQGDLSEAWSESGRDYATVAMRFSALDVTKDQTGRIVQGDLALRTMTTELWTFVRARGGNWLLSAIQQAR